MSHKVPNGSVAGVLREALLLVLAREAAKHGPKAPRTKRDLEASSNADRATRKKTSSETASASAPDFEDARTFSSGDEALRSAETVAAASADESRPTLSDASTGRAAEVLPAELVSFLSRHHKRTTVPVATLRLLWEEEGGRCTAPLANGGTCGSEWQLEPEHKLPVARGGTNDRRNLCLRCRAHNLQAARDVFGGPLMDRFARRKK